MLKIHSQDSNRAKELLVKLGSFKSFLSYGAFWELTLKEDHMVDFFNNFTFKMLIRIGTK